MEEQGPGWEPGVLVLTSCRQMWLRGLRGEGGAGRLTLRLPLAWFSAAVTEALGLFLAFLLLPEPAETWCFNSSCSPSG